MQAPENLKYTKTHEWASIDGDVAKVGLTDYAQDQLGDLVFVNLPEVGDAVEAGEAFADTESVKAVSEIYSPVTGEISAINEELFDAPELINQDPYGTWLIEVSSAELADDLLDAAAYLELCEAE
ncbi:MAG: glycine cleavage system protein GcvH [bacterium]|nr:glycine cleavage system protein GcvH [bacterium]